MPRFLTLRRKATCTDCRSPLLVGEQVRYYSQRNVYCAGKHKLTPTSNPPLGLVRSRQDKYGFYAPDGTKLGSGCKCIDYPCCGH